MIFKKFGRNKITVMIEGMCCARCGEKVEGWLNLIPSVEAEVNYKRKRAVLITKEDVSDEVIKTAVEQSGVYKVTEIIR